MEQVLSSITQMQSALVAVDLVSQHKVTECNQCGALLEGFLAQSICSSCSTPQPVSDFETYFSVLGLPLRFIQDQKLMESRFYQLSRELHPDRFATRGPATASLERMSFLNGAYRTLKNPTSLREYLLEVKGLGKRDQQSSQKNSGMIPLEITESWFEIQDLLMEQAENAQSKLLIFESELRTLLDLGEKQLLELEKKFDFENSSEILIEIDAELQKQSFLKSLKKDVERKNLEWTKKWTKKNANSN